MTTRAEAAYLSRLSDLGCVVCHICGLGQSPAEIHHVRSGQGMSQRAPHWLAVPLCPEHHRGETGLHGLGTRAFERMYGLSELDLLAETIKRMNQ